MHPKFGISQSIARKEDDALLRGNGRYVADHAPPGTLHGVVLRSPHAHARFHIADAGFSEYLQFEVDLRARSRRKFAPLADGGGRKLDLFHALAIA